MPNAAEGPGKLPKPPRLGLSRPHVWEHPETTRLCTVAGYGSPPAVGRVGTPGREQSAQSLRAAPARKPVKELNVQEAESGGRKGTRPSWLDKPCQ